MMAEPTSREDCEARHRGYTIDVGTRLNGMQLQRVKALAACANPGDSVLDVGCNSGFLSRFLPANCRYVGVDVAENLVATARANGLDVRLGAAESLPFEDKSFDVVVIGEVIEHVYDPVAALAECRRVSRNLVVGSTPHEAGKWGTKSVHAHRHHVRCYTEETLKADIRAADLRLRHLSPVGRNGVPQIYVFEAVV